MKSSAPHIAASEFGKVTAISGSHVQVQGLPSVGHQHWVRFENDDLGEVVSFNEQQITIQSFGYQPLVVGTRVFPHTSTPSIRVGGEMVGMCINPLGKVIAPLADRPALDHLHQLPTESVSLFPPAPSLQRRVLAPSPLRTGVGLVDVLIPLAQGQRELVTGDQKTGKTHFLYQVASTQAKAGTIVIWAAIGKRLSEIKQVIEYFDKEKITDRAIIVMSSPQDPNGLIHLTPFTAMSVAEYFRDQGQNVLVIYDDLTNHAKFYRESSLLAKKFPGRDSYPGDMFYVHAHLLERAGTFSHPTQADTSVHISCLAAVETIDNELTEFIASNLISITDGHLLFDKTIYAQGQRPALNTNLSVTRIGKQAQSFLYRSINQELLSFLARYQQLQSLTHFGSELSDESQILLRKGTILQRLFSQHKDELFAIEPLITTIAGLWLDWWPTATDNEMIEYHHALQQHWTSISSTFSKEVFAAKNWPEFLKHITPYSKTIKKACQN